MAETTVSSSQNENLKEIRISDYCNSYDRKIDVDVLKENGIAFMVETPAKGISALVYESHRSGKDMVSFSVYGQDDEGNLILKDGGTLVVKGTKFTIFDLLGMSSYVHSRKSRDIRLLDWKQFRKGGYVYA